MEVAVFAVAAVEGCSVGPAEAWAPNRHQVCESVSSQVAWVFEPAFRDILLITVSVDGLRTRTSTEVLFL
jgi:hypothetical protein